MNINRNNYEQFFILYVDNELNAEERQAVEEFVASNPDLQTELDMFMEVVLQPEPEIVFTAKHTLLKNSNPVNEENFEEYFVLYGDDELSKEDKEFVEQFVYRNPQHQAAFELIQMARVTPDNDIVYAHKEELYRYEKKGGAVIRMQWMRAAAAAVIFLFMGGLGWMFIDGKQDPHLPNADHSIYSQVTPSNPQSNNSSNTQTDNQSNNNSFENNDSKISEQNNSDQNNSVERSEVVNNSSSKVVLAGVSENNSKKVQTTSNKKEPSYVTNTVNADNGNAGSGKSISESVNDGKAESIETAIVSKTVPVNAVLDEPIGVEKVKGRGAGFAVNAGQELQVMQVSNSVEYVDNEPTNNRNKLFRGLVRKATRIIEKSTSIEPGNKERVVQVAGIQIAI
jgi:hypothetical protein